MSCSEFGRLPPRPTDATVLWQQLHSRGGRRPETSHTCHHPPGTGHLAAPQQVAHGHPALRTALPQHREAAYLCTCYSNSTRLFSTINLVKSNCRLILCHWTKWLSVDSMNWEQLWFSEAGSHRNPEHH